MQAVIQQAFLVTVDDHMALRRNSHTGQLPGLVGLVLGADFVVLQVDGFVSGVVQFYP